MEFRAVRTHPSHSAISHSAAPEAVRLGSAAGMAHTVHDRKAMAPDLKAEIALGHWLLVLQEKHERYRCGATGD